MKIIDVVMKLIGPIAPVGDSNIDDQRFQNLEELCRLVDRLTGEIYAIATANKTAPEYSRNRSGKRAQAFLRMLAEAFEEEE